MQFQTKAYVFSVILTPILLVNFIENDTELKSKSAVSIKLKSPENITFVSRVSEEISNQSHYELIRWYLFLLRHSWDVTKTQAQSNSRSESDHWLDKSSVWSFILHAALLNNWLSVIQSKQPCVNALLRSLNRYFCNIQQQKWTWPQTHSAGSEKMSRSFKTDI